VVDLVWLELPKCLCDCGAVGQLELDKLDAVPKLVRRRKDRTDDVVALPQ
jgi:hypothetical protein